MTHAAHIGDPDSRPTAGLLLAAPAIAAADKAQPDDGKSLSGLLPVPVKDKAGKVLFALPKPGADGVSARFLFTMSLRMGLGAAPAFLRSRSERRTPRPSRRTKADRWPRATVFGKPTLARGERTSRLHTLHNDRAR